MAPASTQQSVPFLVFTKNTGRKTTTVNIPFTDIFTEWRRRELRGETVDNRYRTAEAYGADASDAFMAIGYDLLEAATA